MELSISSLDLKSGYWQIEKHPEPREKTAFVTHTGLYDFNVMPFGLTKSGASFQRLDGPYTSRMRVSICLDTYR